MVRKNDHSAIRVLHLYVAGLCGVLRQTRAAKGLRVLACLRGAGASYSKLNHFAIPYFVRLRYGDLGSGLFAVSDFALSPNHLVGEARRLAADLSRESVGASTSSGGIGGAL